MLRLIFAAAISLLFSQTAHSAAGSNCVFQTEWLDRGDAATLFRIPALVDGRKVAIVVDSGAPKTIVSDSLAAKVSNLSGDYNSASAYGGDVSLRRGGNIGVTVGGKTIRLVDIVVADLSSINIAGAGADIILGRDILSRCALVLDADHQRFKISDSASADDGNDSYDYRVPIVYQDDLPLIDVEVGDGGHLFTLIDTALQVGLSVNKPTWAAIRPKGIRETSIISAGLGGWTVSGFAVAPTVSVGGVPFPNIDIIIDSDNMGNEVSAGALGANLLLMANAKIDFKNGFIAISPRKSKFAPPSKSTSGVLATKSGNRLRIMHIMKGSPAAEAGIADSDQICRIDGKPIPDNYESSPMRSWSRDRPGRVVQLTLCDNRTKAVKLKEFY